MKNSLKFELSLADFFCGKNVFISKMGELDLEENGVYRLGVSILSYNAREDDGLFEIYDCYLDFSWNKKFKFKTNSEVLSKLYADDIFDGLENVLGRFFVYVHQTKFLLFTEESIVYQDRLLFCITKVG